jgi:hypothetical protein
MAEAAEGGGPVTVARFDWEMDVSLAASRLDAAGIAAHVPDSVMGTVCWHYAKALGGLRLQVSADDEADARAVLGEPRAEIPEPIVDPKDALAERTLRAVVLGYFASPLLLYACWLLARLWMSGPLSRRARRCAAHATVLLGFMAALGVWWALQ